MDHVVCVGSVAKDVFFPTADGVFLDTPEDVTSQRKVAFEVGAKYQIEDRFEALGGVAANTSVGLARLGVSVSCYGAVGDDDLAAWIRREFDREGVDTGLLEEYKGVKSDLSAILVFSRDGERTIFYNRDSAECFSVKSAQLSGASWVMMSALNGNWEENMRQAVAGAKEVGARLAVNPGQRNMKDNPERVLDAVRVADILLLNKDEAIELVLHIVRDASADQVNDEAFLVWTLFDFGAKKIALTDGARGAWGYDGKDFLRAVARRSEHGIDTTGAGDAFGSAFLAAEISGKSLSEALQWGMINGAHTVRHYGAIEGLCHRDAIESELSDITVTSMENPRSLVV